MGASFISMKKHGIGKHRLILTLFFLVPAIGLLILSGSRLPEDLRNISLSHSRLLSVESLSEMDVDDAMCQLVPASATAALQGQIPPPGGSALDGARVNLERAPVRVIKDPYPTYSAVALDLAN